MSAEIVERIRKVVTELGNPATLYVSPGHFHRAAYLHKVEADDQGAFFWHCATKVRIKSSGAVVDASDVEDLW